MSAVALVSLVHVVCCNRVVICINDYQLSVARTLYKLGVCEYIIVIVCIV